MEPSLSTEELLRMIGREVVATRKACERAANSIGWLLGIQVAAILFGFAYGLGSS